MRRAVIVEAVRTPIGKYQGALSTIEPIHLAATVLRALVERSRIPAAAIDDVMLGCVTQTEEQGANIARLAVLYAGFPVHIPAVSLNRMCGSSQQAIHSACQAIESGDADMVIAAGVESMSRVTMGADHPNALPAGLPYDLVHQGLAAERIASHWALSRQSLDEYAYQSHRKAAAAAQDGRYRQQILPMTVQENGHTRELAHDEGVRTQPDLAKMGALRPAFHADGVITAGNASQISDGAAALLIVDEEVAHRHGLRPRARFLSRVAVGSDPELMLTGPIAATQKALARAELTIDDVAIIEINEAFAPVVLAWAQEIEPPMARVNPNGGAIAHGHPLGATGAILMTKLLYELERTQSAIGLQTMCIGHGQATATIIERMASAPA